MFWISIGQILIIVGLGCFTFGTQSELNKRYEIPKGKVIGLAGENYVIKGEIKQTITHLILLDEKDKNKIFPSIDKQEIFEIKEDGK